jgi:lauroyl/myristoyl acyltransferase
MGLRVFARHLLRVVPPRWLAGAIDRVAPAYARAAIHSAWLPLPGSVERFLERAPHVRGERLRAEDRRRLAAGRLTFLLTRVLVNLALETWPPAGAHRRLPPVEIEGLDHLDAALDRGAGAVLVTAHFGFPRLIRSALATRGIDVVAAGTAGRWADESIDGDIWNRTRGLRRLRAELARRRVCFFLADSRRGRGVEVPVLASRLQIGLGAFTLAQHARCPVLPALAVRRPDGAGFRVEIGPPFALPSGPAGGLPVEAAYEFGRLLESYARRFPDHLFGYQPVFERA